MSVDPISLIGLIGTLIAIAATVAGTVIYFISNKPSLKHVLRVSLPVAIVLILIIGIAVVIPHFSSRSPSPKDIYTWAMQGQPVLDDILNLNAQKDNDDGWFQRPGPNDSCTFTSQTYQVTSTGSNYYQPCIARARSFDNFAFQVQMKILSGDGGGLIFRSDRSAAHYYAFTFCSSQGNCGGTDVKDGYYALYAIGYGLRLEPSHIKSPAINPQLGASNTLAVVALGSDIYLYANGQYLEYVHDTHLSGGTIGVTAYAQGSTTQVEFSHATVWQLSCSTGASLQVKFGQVVC